jgi:anthranilate phosphoribosyltransferase
MGDDMSLLVSRVEAGVDLSMDETSAAIDAIMEGQWSEDEIAQFLVALHRKGETVNEVAGAAAAMRKHVTPVRHRHDVLIDTCGTGGDGCRTFNISTAAALVVAAAGVPVAKHGNRAATSRSGSADVLAVLGVNIEADVGRVEECLDKLGICFCFAPLLHKAMRYVGPVRKRLGMPTIFNVLGPLVNPAAAPYQLVGVGHVRLQPLLAEAMGLLGIRRAVVVHGEDGLDEVTLGAATLAIDTDGHKTRHWRWTAADFGLPATGLEGLTVDGAQQSATIIRAVLAGEPGPARDIVLANAAAALWTVGKVDHMAAGVAMAAETIDSGAAAALLAQWGEMSWRTS